jgi:hypothetical protein
VRIEQAQAAAALPAVNTMRARVFTRVRCSFFVMVATPVAFLGQERQEIRTGLVRTFVVIVGNEPGVLPESAAGKFKEL